MDQSPIPHSPQDTIPLLTLVGGVYSILATSSLWSGDGRGRAGVQVSSLSREPQPLVRGPGSEEVVPPSSLDCTCSRACLAEGHTFRNPIHFFSCLSLAYLSPWEQPPGLAEVPVICRPEQGPAHPGW